ncbi:MAG TPA: SRPBCC domain-containing protein [Vicinamibacterales bacterium]|nr:SRPBCC domain-containing protein [Vicinamibacterales bacterium]
MPGRNALTPEFDHSVLIGAAPTRVLAAFFDPRALAVWWQVARSMTTPRPLGVYAVEWTPTAEPDEILGRLGGVFHGTVMEYKAGREFFVADAWWLAPDGDPIGPMALAVTCAMDGPACRLRVRQTGFEESPRWRRYYGVIGQGWHLSLAGLKRYMESLIAATDSPV